MYHCVVKKSVCSVSRLKMSETSFKAKKKLVFFVVWSEPKVAQAIHLCFAPKMSVMRGDTPPAYFATQGTITTVFPSYWNTMGPNLLKWVFNNRFLRERGMASNPKMEYQVFLCIFQKNSV